jgi:hypothetical protein
MHSQYIPTAHNFKNITGQRFGRLIAIELAGKDHSKKPLWRCHCDCGNEPVIRGESLRSGHYVSCGCYRAEHGIFSRTHGKTGTRTYDIWCGLITRCTNPNDHAYPQYGGRGIKMYEQWRHSFAAFYADMGDAPSNSHSLDRINNDGDYEPANCRWATRTEQNRNRRQGLTLTFHGETLPMAEWAERLGISYHTLYSRIHQLHWDAERALTTPIKVSAHDENTMTQGKLFR